MSSFEGEENFKTMGFNKLVGQIISNLLKCRMMMSGVSQIYGRWRKSIRKNARCVTFTIKYLIFKAEVPVWIGRECVIQ